MSFSPTTPIILEAAARAASDALAEDPVVIDVSEQLYFADVFLILSADNARHLRSIVDAVSQEVKKVTGRLPEAVDGEWDATWVAVDYGDVVVHVFLKDDRQYYSLEKLWGMSPRLSLPFPEQASPVTP